MPSITQGPEGEPSAPYRVNKTNWKFLLVVIVLAVIVGGGIYYLLLNEEPVLHGCTMEAYICPDGTAVGRTGPNCEFAECPPFVTPDETADWQVYRNEEYGFEVKYPPIYEEAETSLTEILSGQLVAAFQIRNIEGETTNLLDIAVFDDSFGNYQLLDQSGGFGFYFDTKNNQWLHLKGETSEFIPKKIGDSIEAYIYRSGDITCNWDWLIIPHPSYSYVVEVTNITCAETKDEDYQLPSFILDSDQIISTFRFIEIEAETALKNIRDVDFIEYLTNVYYAGMGGPSEFCMSGRDPIIISYIKYYDLDNDGEEEAIIRAYTCFTGTAGPDINSIYKLLPTEEVIELKTNNFFQGKNVFDEHNWKNYGFDVRDGKLINTVPIYNDNDSNCCPTGGIKEILYKWNGKEFVVTDVLFKQ